MIGCLIGIVSSSGTAITLPEIKITLVGSTAFDVIVIDLLNDPTRFAVL